MPVCPFQALLLLGLALLAAVWLYLIGPRRVLPQYHGRRHLWPEAWLHDLRAGIRGTRELFDAR